MSEIERRRRMEEEQRRQAAMAGGLPPAGMQPGMGQAAQPGMPQGIPAAGPAAGMGAMGAPQGAQPAGGGFPDGRAVMTGEEEAAYNLGQRMGAQSLMQAAGIAPAAEEKPQAGMNVERIRKATQTLLDY